VFFGVCDGPLCPMLFVGVANDLLLAVDMVFKSIERS
jgi:hypothetical protein